MQERVAAERRGIRINRAETGWEVTIYESGQSSLRLEIPAHRLLMEIVAALAEEAPTAVDGLAAVAATGDTSIEYRLPHVAWPDTSGPWGRDERGPIRAYRAEHAAALEALATAEPSEYPAAWARAVIAANAAHEEAPALLQQHEGE